MQWGSWVKMRAWTQGFWVNPSGDRCISQREQGLPTEAPGRKETVPRPAPHFQEAGRTGEGASVGCWWEWGQGRALCAHIWPQEPVSSAASVSVHFPSDLSSPAPQSPLVTNTCSSSQRGPKPPSPTHEEQTDFETEAGKFCVLPSVILNQC